MTKIEDKNKTKIPTFRDSPKMNSFKQDLPLELPYKWVPFLPSNHIHITLDNINIQTQEPNLLQGLLVKPLELVITSLNPPLFSTTRLAFLQLKHLHNESCMLQKWKTSLLRIEGIYFRKFTITNQTQKLIHSIENANIFFMMTTTPSFHHLLPPKSS